MASNSKYQPAPQQDPDDYTHAPPAYAHAESSASARDETQGLFGAPRSSEDNLPDDFKVGPLPGCLSLGVAAMSASVLNDADTDNPLVWWLRRRSHRRYPQPVHPQGLHHPDRPAARHCRCQRPHFLQRVLQDMDPEPPGPRLGFCTSAPLALGLANILLRASQKRFSRLVKLSC